MTISVCAGIIQVVGVRFDDSRAPCRAGRPPCASSSTGSSRRRATGAPLSIQTIGSWPTQIDTLDCFVTALPGGRPGLVTDMVRRRVDAQHARAGDFAAIGAEVVAQSFHRR